MRIDSPDPLFSRINASLLRINDDLSHAKAIREAMKDVKSDLIMSGLDDSIGRSLHNVFCGIEDILGDIAETVDGEKPFGGGWHSKLLDQMSHPTSLRPAVIEDDEELRDLMRFRHVFGKTYGKPLRHEEFLAKLTVTDETILPSLLSALQVFRSFLETSTQETSTESNESESATPP